MDWNAMLAYQEEHRRDLLREAERGRLLRQARAGRAADARRAASSRRAADARVDRRALSWLGRRMVAWGCSLQERYGVAVEVPRWQAANRCR